MMRPKFRFGALLLVLFSVNAVGQNSVQITSRKVTHPKPESALDQFHLSIDVTYLDVVSEDAPVAEIMESVSYWTNYETTLNEVLVDNFTSEMTHRVNYNGRGILDVTLSHHGSTVYPSEFVENVIIDLETGESIKLKTAFENRTGLYNLIATAHQAEVDEAGAENEEVAGFLKDALQYFSIYEIEDFTVSDQGVTFLFDYEFAHAIKAAQPEGRYFFTWKELTPFVSEYGPLRYFLKPVEKPAIRRPE